MSDDVAPTVELNYTPRKWVARLIAQRRFGRRTVLNCHRGSGKTLFAIATLLEQALNAAVAYDERGRDGLPARFGYVAMSIGHAKQTAWNTFAAMLGQMLEARTADGTPLVVMNSNDLTIRFWNGVDILLTGIDNPEKCRGQHFRGLVVDEAQRVPKDVWATILGPTTTQHKAWIILIGTPNGPQGFFYEAFLLGQQKDTGWVSITQTIEDTGEYDPEELEAQKRISTREQIRQEYYCDFSAAISNRVYPLFDPTVHVRSDIADDGKSPLYIGLDFNVDFMPAICAQKVGDKLHIFAEFVLKQTNTDQMAAFLTRQFPGRHVIICPDASGKARSTKSDNTDFTLLRRYGFRLSVPGNNPAITDRVQAVNVMLESASGARRIFIHPKCETLIKTLTFQQVDAQGLPAKKDDLDHPGDALGYLVWQTFPLKRVRFRQKHLAF